MVFFITDSSLPCNVALKGLWPDPPLTLNEDVIQAVYFHTELLVTSLLKQCAMCIPNSRICKLHSLLMSGTIDCLL